MSGDSSEKAWTDATFFYSNICILWFCFLQDFVATTFILS
jgi:hypothetical protein